MALELLWPSPKPLEGVKSRKRAIFEVDAAQLRLPGGETILASGLSLSAASRIAAVGEAGRAAVSAWLLGCAEAGVQVDLCEAGGVSRHQDLTVARFGPGSAGDSAVAIADEVMQRRPQVVVLDEALEAKDAEWSRTFSEVLRSEALRSFKGAVVVCVAEDAQDIAALVCSECWALIDSQLRQEPCLRAVEDALGVEADATVNDLLEQALAIESCHLAYWIDKGRNEGCTITLFAKPGVNGTQNLVGFLCHRMHTSLAEFKVEFVFVPEWLRGSGYGKRLMSWVIGRAARMPLSECRWISLSAVDEKCAFYEQFGFVDMGSCESKGEEEQTWMELSNKSFVSEEM